MDGAWNEVVCSTLEAAGMVLVTGVVCSGAASLVAGTVSSWTSEGSTAVVVGVAEVVGVSVTAAETAEVVASTGVSEVTAEETTGVSEATVEAASEVTAEGTTWDSEVTGVGTTAVRLVSSCTGVETTASRTVVGGVDDSTVGETTGVVNSAADDGTIGTDSVDGVAIDEADTGMVGGMDDSNVLLELTVGGSGGVEEDTGIDSSVGDTKDVVGKVEEV